MSKMTYIATIINHTNIQVELSTELPDFIHAVKYDPNSNIEVIFDADYDWTPELEDTAMSVVQSAMYQQLPA